jgi:hypothetical protein
MNLNILEPQIASGASPETQKLFTPNSGTVNVGDHIITYFVTDGKVTFKVTDFETCETQMFEATVDAFFRALSIAVHPTGMPDFDKDYMWAESIMPKGKLRWIP